MFLLCLLSFVFLHSLVPWHLREAELVQVKRGDVPLAGLVKIAVAHVEIGTLGKRGRIEGADGVPGGTRGDG